MPSNKSSRLAFAHRTRQLVRFKRPFERGSITGYILAIGPRWILLALIGDGVQFNGFLCVRKSDVRQLQTPHPHANFLQTAMKMRGDHLPPKPRIATANTAALLRSAARSFPLVTIHREIIQPGVCQIGRILTVKNGHVSLVQINPDAKWDFLPTPYLLSQITRIDFGGQYEEALHLVGGNP